MFQEYRRQDYWISTDPAKLDARAIHSFLTRAYWSEGISPGQVEKALRNSMCFALFHGKHQIGLARVITDQVTYAYLCDVYVLEKYRGKGLGVWLMECVMSHPDLQGLRRFSLATRDAHGLYRKFGFAELQKPQSYMEILRNDVYLRSRK